jgi:parallel beta-helix repeat protein
MKNNYEGLVIGGSSNALVTGNKIMSNFGNLGVMINYSTSITFSRNYVWKNICQGLVVFRSSSCIISENQIVENDDKSKGWTVGIVLSSSIDIKVFGNNITANADHGLNIVGGSTNEIFDNVMSKNKDGICITQSTNNNIYQNTLQFNEYGFECWGASNNRIYHNNILDNICQAYDFLTTERNVWDKGYPSGGNYWSDYVGNDTNSDDIGDTPYVIDLNNQDNYPLMAKFNTSNVIPPSPSPSPSPPPTPTPTPTPIHSPSVVVESVQKSTSLPISPSSSPEPTPRPLATPFPFQAPKSALEQKQNPWQTFVIAGVSGTLLTIFVGQLVYFKKRKH